MFRGFPGRDAEVPSGVWKRKALPRLAGRTIGLVGLGRIGQAVVPRAIGLGLSVIAYDPFPNEAFAGLHGVRLCGLKELLVTADIVSLHSPVTPDTANLIDAQTLAKMKPGAVLINTARGGLVDEEALAAALASGHLMAAGLDAFKIEPLPIDSPLQKLDNVLLAAHGRARPGKPARHEHARRAVPRRSFSRPLAGRLRGERGASARLGVVRAGSGTAV